MHKSPSREFSYKSPCRVQIFHTVDSSAIHKSPCIEFIYIRSLPVENSAMNKSPCREFNYNNSSCIQFSYIGSLTVGSSTTQVTL